MANGMDGFAKLGELITGGGGSGNGSQAYVGGYTEGQKARGAMYDADKSREEARIARAMAIARESIPDAVAQAEYAENQRALVAATLMASPTVDLRRLGALAVPQAGAAYQAAATAAGEGDAMEQNRQTALATGKPFEPYEDAAGGKAVLNPATGDIELTALGDAALGSQQALTTAREASAAASQSRADLTARTDPNRPRSSGGGAAKPEDPTSEKAVLAQAREAIAAGADPEAVRKRMRSMGYSNIADKL